MRSGTFRESSTGKRRRSPPSASLLYDKICREDILVHAYRLVRVNAGAPGVDRMTFARIEERGLEAWLAGLRAELVSKTYRPDPVQRVMIPKANGGDSRTKR